MNLYELHERPKNLQSYLRPPDEAKTDAQIAAWLRKMLQQAEMNLHIPECFLQTVKEVHQVAAQGGYRISFMPIAGKTASAEFFFCSMHSRVIRSSLALLASLETTALESGYERLSRGPLESHYVLAAARLGGGAV